MSIAKFFELDWRKNIIFVIILVISTFFSLFIQFMSVHYVGFPLRYHERWVIPPTTMIEHLKSIGVETEVARSTFFILPFLIDMSIYYIVVCALVVSFKSNEFKKRPWLDYLTLGIAAFLTIGMFLLCAISSDLVLLW